MKLKPTPIVVALYFLGLFSVPGMAATTEKKPDNAKLIGTLTQRTEMLEQQIQELQAELKELKKTSHNEKQRTEKRIEKPYVEKERPLIKYRVLYDRATGRHFAVPMGPCGPRSSNNEATSSAETNDGSSVYLNAAQGESEQVAEASTHRSTHPLSAAGEAQVPPAEREPIEQASIGGAEGGDAPLKLLINAPYTFGGMPIVTSPYLGERSAFDASDLISNFPNVQLSLRLLQQRQKIENVFKDHNIALPDKPYVDVSGTIQPIAFITKPYQGSKRSGIDVPTAYVDFLGNINRWVDAFMRIALDSNPPNSFIPPVFGPTVANSRAFVDQAFVTLGNLNCSPFYFTMGQIYVPFGRYSTNMVSSPLTSTLARIKARAVLLGYKEQGQYNGFSAQVFGFKGDSRANFTADRINNWGANAAYLLDMKKWHFKLGGSYVENMADSLGMQLNGAGSGFEGFAGQNPDNAEVLRHRVPGADIHTELGIGNFGFLGEYLTATKSFDRHNVSFNHHGAKPSASNLEAVYNFNISCLPASIAVGYQTTRQSLAFLLPKDRYIGTFNISLWRDTVESIEFHHDKNYGECDRARGQDIRIPDNGLGHSANTLIFQFAAFF